MFNKILCSFLCGCLVFMGLSASGGNIQIKTDHNANPCKALKKSDAKAEKTVNSDDDPYNYVVHNSGDPAPDELNYFIKGSEADWMADFLQNHNDINYCLVLDKENGPVGVMGPYNICIINSAHSSNYTYIKTLKGVSEDRINKSYYALTSNGEPELDQNIINFSTPPEGEGDIESLTSIEPEEFFFENWQCGILLFIIALTLSAVITTFIWCLRHKANNIVNDLFVRIYSFNIINSNNNWCEVLLNLKQFDKEKYNFNAVYIYPNKSFAEDTFTNRYSNKKTTLNSENYFFRYINSKNNNIFFYPWNMLEVDNLDTAYFKVYDIKDQKSFNFTEINSSSGEKNELIADSWGLFSYSFNASVLQKNSWTGIFNTKNYIINIGGGEEKGLTAAPAESFFMFWLNNQASSDLPYNVHFVSTADDINGGYFILPQSSEMNWNTSDDHIPVPNANIYTPNDYTFENIADNENVTPYYEKDKNPGYDYMQITQSGKYCVFPIGFTGKDNSSSSTLEVWISPKNGTAEDSYIHVGNIKAQYSSSDSQWHFTYTPVSTPSGWNVTAEKIDITGTSKEDMLSGTTLDNFGLSIVQENSRKMAI